jgi:hypothetical protein
MVLYHTQDGRTRINVRLIQESVWLTLNQISDLFQRDKPVISKHTKNIFETGELHPDRTVAKFATVQTEGGRSVTREIEFYRLEVILAVGYRVKRRAERSSANGLLPSWSSTSSKASLWTTNASSRPAAATTSMNCSPASATSVPRNGCSGGRSSTIYATSVDYDPSSQASQKFFAVVQNKMHWAAHGHTAAEVIVRRADSSQPNMGLTTWTGSRPRRTDVGFAKNYLTHEEIETLDLIVSAYLDFAELQARNLKPMTMRDWIAKLDSFLTLSDRDPLRHAGTISHDAALAKAQSEFDKFRVIEDAKPRPVDLHFAEALDQAKQIAAAKTNRKPKKGQE